MSISPPLSRVLRNPYPTAPRYVTRLAIRLIYQGAYKRSSDFQGRKEANLLTMKDVEQSLHAGFFHWSDREGHAKAHFSAYYDAANDLLVRYEGGGVHYNFIVALLRAIVTANYMTKMSYERRLAIFGRTPSPDDFRHFDQFVSAIAFESLEGEWYDHIQNPDFSSFLLGNEIVIPINDFGLDRSTVGMVAAKMDAFAFADRIAVSADEEISFDPGQIEALSDTFLRLCDCGVFRPLDELESESYDGRFEIFLRNGDRRPELVIDDYTPEMYGLVEFLNCVSKGRSNHLRMKVVE